ncbi:MAG TPA: site-2 protease family protein [Polyangia bacterium]|jgi:Zn-dependent protease/CBS domain-containing protein
MFGKRFHLFTVLGFAVRADASWLVLAVLVAWSLARGLFPTYFPGLSAPTRWLMGAAGALGLFVSIVVHELSHSLVARRFGIPLHGITLFIFGGVAEMEQEPTRARAEFCMAIVGPITSLVLGGALLVVARVAPLTPGTAIVSYLAVTNLLLAAFNLVPAFPLDGGRVLRSVLWRLKRDVHWATRVASISGATFGVALVGFGVVAAVRGTILGGLWWVLIGLFLFQAARGSYRQLVRRPSLDGEAVRHFMRPTPVSVAASTSLRALFDDYIFRHHHSTFPVVHEGRLVGWVSAAHLRAVPPGEWELLTVAALASPCGPEITITPEADASAALTRMQRHGLSRLLVVDGDHLVGILALKDMLRFLTFRPQPA